MGGRRLWALARPGVAGLLHVCGVRTWSLSSLVCKRSDNHGASLQGGGRAGTAAPDRKRGRGGWRRPAVLGTRSLAALGTGGAPCVAHVSPVCIQTGLVLGPHLEWEMLQGRFHRKNIIGKMGDTG